MRRQEAVVLWVILKPRATLPRGAVSGAIVAGVRGAAAGIAKAGWDCACSKW
ncbi:hypothetical protein [Bartonella sp. AU55XJBT]|uniref:hypothetical protein n=1 Tax=Bartonella sp. AU55XJBT TaxID=3019091 RepID=UPI002360DA7E|nr:hypothetical protein [Bartonella sp. AU55XJBT]